MPSHAASVAAPLLRLFQAAETPESRMEGFIWTHSELDVLLGLLFDVKA
jgi:hypothetical protein